jgi:anti-sigma regulatory factor (Ser/Thr protein kinase)|tara:strand:- start:1546 stop:1983 length:438 start_codon:yes stop_codon:yes gene_type:complete
VTGEIELSIPVRVDYVQLVRAVVGSLAATNPELSTARIADLRLVVSEALTNAIRAQEKNSISERLYVLCKLTDSAIEVEVRDNATGFDVDLIRDLPPTESPERLQHERGLGLSIMREMSDGLEIKSGPDGTVVHMTINSSNSNNS